MTRVTALWIFLLSGSLKAADSKPGIVIACNPRAISLAERPRYNALTNRLRAAIQKRVQQPGGYAYKLDSNKVTLPQVAEWISMERLCCPFLKFEISVEPNQLNWHLLLTGPIGVKALLQEEFPSR